MNTFRMRKYGAFALAGFMPTIMFFIAMLSFGIFYAYLFFGAGLILAIVLGSFLLRHPLLQMAEGSGIAIFSIDSTGIIKPYLAKVRPPYISSNVGGRRFSTVFDRNIVHYLNPFRKARVSHDDDSIKIELPKKEYSSKLFSFSGAYPVLIYNSVLKEFYTKELFSKMETEVFVQHLVLYLNRKVDELTSSIRDFARYIVDQTKPKTNIFQSKVFWIVMAAVVLLLVLFFAPQIMKTLGTVSLPDVPIIPVNPRGG